MAELTVDKIRNVVLVSHSGAGKTSLTDMLAFRLGAGFRLGKVDEGTSISDYSEDEKKRGISISSSIFSLNRENFRINLIDTPGYLEFIGEVIGSLKAADSAIVLVDASSGIEIGTEKSWELLNERNLPRVILINRIDMDNVNFLGVVEEIKKSFGKNCVLFQIPNALGENYKNSVSLLAEEIETDLDIDISSARQFLIEAIAESKDELLEEYLDKGTLSEEKLKDGLKLAIATQKIVPIFCGSAHVSEYADKFIDSVIKFFPSPKDVEEFKTEVAGEDETKTIAIKVEQDSPFYAQVFKTQIDPYIGQLSIFKVVSGSVNSNEQVYNASKNSYEKLGQLYLLQGKEQKALDKAIAGDIVAVAKLKNTEMSDTFCEESNKVIFPEIEFPEPVLSASITPESREDEKKISQTLRKLAQEDQTFKISHDQQTKEMIISGMGSLHLEIMANRTKERYGVNVKIGTPKVPYKETITETVKVQGKYKKQTGGRGQYGDVWLELVPLERGKGFEFEDRITGGVVPKQYIPAVEKGIRNAIMKGVISGYPLVDFKAMLYDGSYHNVDSSDMAFQIAASMALKEGIKKAKPVLLGPIMDADITVEEEFMGQINKDLSSRRGRIMGMGTKGKFQVINAKVPLSEMLKYASELKSMTGGRGVFTMKFSHYEQLPFKLAEKIIEENRTKEE